MGNHKSFRSFAFRTACVNRPGRSVRPSRPVRPAFLILLLSFAVLTALTVKVVRPFARGAADFADFDLRAADPSFKLNTTSAEGRAAISAPSP